MSVLKFAFRQLRKNPGFTTVAVLTLALGIGANTAIFSVANTLLLRPLAGVERPAQLVMAGRTHNGSGFDSFSYPDYVDYRDQNNTLSGLAAYRATELYVGSDGRGEFVAGALVSHNYFELLGARPLKGRTLLPEDEAGPGANPVCVISYGLWRNQFAFDPNIIGKTFVLNGHNFAIVGVAAEKFIGTDLGQPADIWMPITMYAQANPIFSEKRLEARHIVWLRVFGRLNSNATLAQAQTQLSAIALRLEQTYPETNKGMGIEVFPGLRLQPQRLSEARRSTALLMSIAALVLLIACANVANLLVARASARQREVGIRFALGATSRRLVSQLLTEALLVGAMSGLLGLAVAFLLSDLLIKFNPIAIASRAPGLGLDWRVFAFTMTISMLSALIFGLVPALQISQPRLVVHLKDRTGAAPRRSRFASGLIVAQTALSLVALISAGLLVRTLQNLQEIRPGFNTENVAFAQVDLGRQGYSETQGRLFYQRLIETVETLPGVSSASLGITVPLGGSWRTGLKAEGHFFEKEIPCNYNVVARRYFETTGVPLIAGRDFGLRDKMTTPGVVIINETFARQLFPQQSPIGKRVLIPRSEGGASSFEVIGVARDAKYGSLTEPSQPFIYLSALQQYQPAMTLFVRSTKDARELTKPLQQQIFGLDNRLAVNFTTVADRLAISLRPQRGAAMLVGVFGLLALLLSTVGLYGLMAYAVSQRRQEIGIRMALGARTHDIARMVLGQGMLLTTLGVAAGLAGAVACSRWLASFLHGVSPTDPLTFFAVISILAMVALMACWIPARRATKVDPVVALRYE